MTRSSAAEFSAETAGPVALRALRAVAPVSVLFIVLQGVTAGEILSHSPVAESLHYAGAFAVHVFTGLTALAAFLVTRRRRGPWWPTAVATAVFLVGFAQAAFGEAGMLMVHVPLAMLLLVGAVMVMGWSFDDHNTTRRAMVSRSSRTPPRQRPARSRCRPAPARTARAGR